ncbi:hypothetical protein K7432_017286 [Basidiobolus ranarum]|uniref:Uncharacterized protein n=1 Tax=Basidiobolus ranarum TaxID=34480 RepID=A0ABR2WDL5_9FUNG
MKRAHTANTSTPEEISKSWEPARHITYKGTKVASTTLISIQLFTALTVSIILGIIVWSISHDSRISTDSQPDLKNLLDTHYMSLVMYILTTVNTVTGLLGIKKDCRKMLNIYLVFNIITMLFKIASGCLYIVWHSKSHAIFVMSPSLIDLLCIISVYILRKRIKSTSCSAYVKEAEITSNLA